MPAIWNPNSINLTAEVYTPTAASRVDTRTAYILTNSGRWLLADPLARLASLRPTDRRSFRSLR